MLVVGVVLIAEDMGALLVCNLLQSQDANTQIDASENRVILDNSLGSDSSERRLGMMNREAIPLMPRSSGSGWATREMGAAFAMAGASYLPWLAGTLEERPGEGTGCPSTRGCLSPMNWEIASMDCCTVVGWFGTMRTRRGG